MRLLEKLHFIRSLSQPADNPPYYALIVCSSTEPISYTGQLKITLQRWRNRLASEVLEQARDTLLPTTGNSLVLDVINACMRLRKFRSDGIPHTGLDFGGVEPTSRSQIKKQRRVHCGE